MLAGRRFGESRRRQKPDGFLWSDSARLIFAALHIREWIACWNEGVSLFQNPVVRLFLDLPFSV